MVKNNRVVVGSYENQDEAASIINRLKEDGYQREDITLYGNSTDVDVETDNVGQTTNDQEEDRSFWDKVKDAFSTDSYDYETNAEDPDYNQEDDVLYPYRDDITSGKTVIVVDNYRGDTNLETNRTETSVKEKTQNENLTEDEKIRLKEERLEVDKEEVRTGEVNVRKETKHETKTVDVPVESEEVVIERKPVAGEDSKTTDTEIDEETESFSIPVKEEKVEVNKKPVVKEEVDIKKKRHEEVEEVTEDVKREELDVDAKGRTGMDRTKRDLDKK